MIQIPDMGRNLINNPATEKFNELDKDVKVHASPIQ
jgi:hypothetical protein